MDGVLSQEEINALLDGGGVSGGSSDSGSREMLTDIEKDTIGEISNISMGTASTTLFSLVNRKVEISTPVVSEAEWSDIAANYEKPCVFIRIGYTLGLDGSNILVLKESDVKIITDLMMGGDGTGMEGELTELHLSAISEAMNQMMGSAATSLSSMLNKMIDISPPVADLIDLNSTEDESEIDEFLSGKFVKISFKMQIGDLVDSEIMQLYPYSFAHEMCDSITGNMMADSDSMTAETEAASAASAPPPAPAAAPPPPAAAAPPPAAAAPPPAAAPMPQGMPMMQPVDMSMYGAPVNVQPAQFVPFTGELNPMLQKENINLIMDVPLEVTVELGRTSKSISEILDFSPGTIIELNKLAGEPVDILVNGKYVAKGEVVVIEESFGVRLTEIIK